MYLALWLIRRWRLPATPALILPLAVILKRFFAPDLVFSFGISRRSRSPVLSKRVDEPPWHAFGQAVPKSGGSYAKGRRNATIPCRRSPRRGRQRPLEERHDL